MAEQESFLFDSKDLHPQVRVVDSIPDHCACGSQLFNGFGLLGGGYGPYGVCDDCGATYKTPLPDDED